MRKLIWIYGLVFGAIMTVWMTISMTMLYNGEFEGGNMFVGFGAMILVFSFMYVAMRQYRDNHNGGVITFGQALKMGTWIAFITSTIYLLSWVVLYHFKLPEFADRYADFVITQAKDAGKSAAEIAKVETQMAEFKEDYKNPILFTLWTYAEIFLLEFLVALICAAIVKRKTKEAI